jgi:hypothetical protein
MEMSPRFAAPCIDLYSGYGMQPPHGDNREQEEWIKSITMPITQNLANLLIPMRC